ncbi:hypothetical protein PR048_011947 [Dryococelus australis]|uniref:YqaJ viral recombinase domain-containing protein n=1 Tax=Dryococelus australis TaxID=614101 RepID=A0ABQ9HN43_9NEOP|nr:hypothetical protein PR048_011947 [Dryococelus australis]
MRDSTAKSKTVLSLLYSDFSGTRATKYGIEKERIAIEELEIRLGDRVQRTGQWVDEKLPFTGASPDGLRGEDGLVEIRCPYSARDLTPEQAVKEKNVTFFTVHNGQMNL